MTLKEEALKLWEKEFGINDYGFDFGNALILKSEFQTDSDYSWDLDYFDYQNKEKFISSTKNIQIRNKQSKFVIKNEKYFICKNPDFTYSIINTNSVNSESNALNIDLFYLNRIKNFKKDNFIVLSLSIKKMKPAPENNFLYNFQDLIQIFFPESLMTINNDFSYKTLITILIKTENILLTEIMKKILKVNSLIQLLIFRIKQVYSKIWINLNDDEKEEENSKHFYNLFLFKNDLNSKLSIYEENKIKLLDLINTFNNTIFCNEKLVNTFLENNFNKSEFRLFDHFADLVIYEYPFLNHEFNTYLKIAKEIK